MCAMEMISRMIFHAQIKMIKNSRRPKNMPRVSVHRTTGGADAEVTPTESPTVLRDDADSNMASGTENPYAEIIPTETAKQIK